MNVFVTGGTGLLGTHVAALLRREGHQVTALCRPSADATHLEAMGCALTRGDVTDSVAALAPRMAGCSHLVHGAALVYTGGDWERIRSVNAGGTGNVMRAAAEAGVGHAVHLSSVAVYGTVDGPTDEEAATDRPVPETDYYARSKREAEGAARTAEEALGLPVTVLRPSAVYGEWDRLMTQRIARMVRGPVAFLLGPGDNTIPAVYAGNVAEAVLLALAAGRGGATYNVGMDHPLTQRQLLQGIAKGMGRSPWFVPVPSGMVRVGADLLQALGVPAPGAPHLPLGRVVRLALGENPYPSQRIRSELGWAPSHSHEVALVRAGAWLREHLRNQRRRKRAGTHRRK